MVLKDVTRLEFDGLKKLSGGFEFRYGLGRGGVLIGVDHPRSRRGGVSHSCGLSSLFLGRMDVRS